jgi:hypothetical protein
MFIKKENENKNEKQMNKYLLNVNAILSALFK